MNSLIVGITVTLVNTVITGTDPLGNPVYREESTDVENCLVAPASTDDITTSVNLYGKQARYILAVPKGDAHTWENQEVRFFGVSWRVFGFPLTGIEANIPGPWNTKYYLERYE